MDAVRLIGRYIAATSGEPFSWQGSNCALWAAGGVDLVVGVDPAADIRARRWSRWEWLTEIRRSGGLMELVAPRLDAAGLSRGLGDGVGVFRADGRDMCGFFHSGRAAAKMQAGVRFYDDFETLGCWLW